MAIHNWPLGQLILFWAGMAFVEFVLYQLSYVSGARRGLFGLGLILALLVVPCVAFAVGWMWFEAKPQGRNLKR